MTYDHTPAERAAYVAGYYAERATAAMWRTTAGVRLAWGEGRQDASVMFYPEPQDTSAFQAEVRENPAALSEALRTQNDRVATAFQEAAAQRSAVEDLKKLQRFGRAGGAYADRIRFHTIDGEQE
jgi:hypothetical protein